MKGQSVPKSIGILPGIHFFPSTLGWWINMFRCFLQICFYVHPKVSGRSTLDRVVFANGLETVRVKWHIFKVLRNGLLRYILYTCPNLWCNSCSKCYGMDCLGIYFTHVQTCDVTRVQSAIEWTAWVHTSHTSKPVMWLVFKVLRNGLLRYILYTCPNLWCNSCSKCYGMDFSGTYFTHVQTCDVTRVQSAIEWTAWVHTSHMSKPVM